MSTKLKLALIACALTATLLGAAAGAAQAEAPKLGLLDRPADRFHDSIETHRVATRYEALADRAKRLAARAPRIARRPDFGLAPGVSRATLDAIASCESGGDPTIVDSSGTYHGLYQFDLGTWESVGGSGLPSEASAEEQTHRASLLYSRAGSSPWPVCG